MGRYWWQETYEELGGITAEEWLREEYPDKSNRELAEELSALLGRRISIPAVENRGGQIGLKKRPQTILRVGREAQRARSWWHQKYEKLGGATAAAWLEREYPNRSNIELAKELKAATGLDIRSHNIIDKARRLQLRRPPPSAPPQIAIPDFLDYENVSGTVTISGDYHIPLHDIKLVEKMVYVSQKMGAKKLIIAGDLYNFDAFSTFVNEPIYEVGEELDYGEKLLDYLAEWFDFILVLMGNHEERLYKRKLDKYIDWERLTRMLHQHENKIKFSKYGYCVLNDAWRITHPKNYSQIKTRVANRIALKHRQNVLNFHGHALSVASDDSGHQVIADGGGLFDEKKIEYRMIKDSTYPAWATGFWVITKENELHSFNDLFTPWKFYEKAWANEKDNRGATKGK